MAEATAAAAACVLLATGCSDEHRTTHANQSVDQGINRVVLYLLYRDHYLELLLCRYFYRLLRELYYCGIYYICFTGKTLLDEFAVFLWFCTVLVLPLLIIDNRVLQCL